MAYTTGPIYVIETTAGRFASSDVPAVGDRGDTARPERLRVGHGRSRTTLPDGRLAQKCMLATAEDIRAWRDAELAGDVELMDAADYAAWRRRQWPDVYDAGDIER